MSTHPFTGGPHPTDVRITTRYSSDNWLEGMAGTVHEVGHALYEQVRPCSYNTCHRTSHTAFDDSCHDSAERDREISTVRIMDCCGFALYYLVTHTITSLNILSIYFHNVIKHFIYRVEILSTTTCRCPSPSPWVSMRASRCFGNVWSSR